MFSSVSAVPARFISALVAGTLLMGLSAAPAQAQHGHHHGEDHSCSHHGEGHGGHGDEASPMAFSIELNGGGAFYGDFLEQRVDGRERELTSEPGFSFGAALGVRLFERNVVRLSLDYLTGQFEYRDDTGDGREVLDEDGLPDFQLFAISGEAERTFFRVGPIAPYASVGLSGGFWQLGDGDGLTAEGASETLFRWGGTSGIGARVELSSNFSLNLEANALSLGNPFDGSEAFRVDEANDSEATFEEPPSVSTLRVRGGLRYIF